MGELTVLIPIAVAMGLLALAGFSGPCGQVSMKTSRERAHL